MGLAIKEPVMSYQCGVKTIYGKVSRGRLDLGGENLTIISPSTGDYTLTVTYPLQTLLGVKVTPVDDNVMICVPSATVSEVTVKITQRADGADVDGDFWIEITATDIPYEF